MSEITTGFSGPRSEHGMPVMHMPQGAVEQERQNLYKEAWADLLSRGWNATSLVNLHPFKLYTTGVKLKELRVPGVPRVKELWDIAPKLKLASGIEIPYFQHIFDYPDIDIAPRLGNSELNPEVITGVHTTLPWHMAADVLQQNNNPRTRGGVFAYDGTHAPLSNPKTREVEKTRLEIAHAQQITYYNGLMDEANGFHSSGNPILLRELGKSKYHKWAAEYMRLLGLLEKDPPWFNRDVIAAQGRLTKVCKSCGQEVKEEALRCTNGTCTYIFNPFEAYKAGIFDEETPGGVLALRRCTKEQLIELHLYPDIKPQGEHAKDRAKEAKEKKPKE